MKSSTLAIFFLTSLLRKDAQNKPCQECCHLYHLNSFKPCEEMVHLHWLTRCEPELAPTWNENVLSLSFMAYCFFKNGFSRMAKWIFVIFYLIHSSKRCGTLFLHRSADCLNPTLATKLFSTSTYFIFSGKV